MRRVILLEFIFGSRHRHIERRPQIEPDLGICYALWIDIVDMSFVMGIVVSNHGLPLAVPQFELHGEMHDIASTIQRHASSDLNVLIEPYDPGA